MAKLTKSELKAIFSAGSVPTEAQFASLIDSQVNVSETSPSDSIVVLNITASGNISASGTVFADNFQSSGGDDVISFTDDLKLVGDLTSSGNISSSGTIISNVITPTTITNVSTTHVTASGAISASGNLIVGGTSTLNDAVTIPKLVKLYFDSPSGLHIYSEGTATDENQIILAKTNNLRILNQAHGKDIIFGTENGSGTAKTPLTLSGSGDAVFGGGVTVAGNVSASGTLYASGILDTNVVEQSGTAAEDLTSVAKNTIWYSNSAQAADITLPQATATNAGMVIKIIVGTTDWSGTAFKLGFANGGSTVMTGYIRLGSNAGSEAVDGFVVTANAKALTIDADDVTGAGGAIGSTYTFTYLEANLVHVEANGQVTTGTPALDAGASVTAGI